jgi:hypothetical protein
MKNFIKEELSKILADANYYGTEEQIVNEIYILDHSDVEMDDRESIEEYYTRLCN